jgi:hypothetical protein
MKPRMRRVVGGVGSLSFILGMWECGSPGRYGYGYTLEDAYRDWLRA